MKCKNCGTEFKEGFFCPECGTKWDKQNATVKMSSLTVDSVIPEQTESTDIPEMVGEMSEIKGQNTQNPDIMEEKIPWYLSIWFILLLTFFVPLGVFPAIALGVMRYSKYKKRRLP